MAAPRDEDTSPEPGRVLFVLDRFERLHFRTPPGGAQVVIDGRAIWFHDGATHTLNLPELLDAVDGDAADPYPGQHRPTLEERVARLERERDEEAARRWLQ